MKLTIKTNEMKINISTLYPIYSLDFQILHFYSTYLACTLIKMKNENYVSK